MRSALSSYCRQGTQGPWNLGNGLMQTSWEFLDIHSMPCLLLLAAQMKSKTHHTWSQWWTVTSLSRVWQLQAPPSPCGPLLAGPDQEQPLGGGQPVGQEESPPQVRQKLLLTPHLHPHSSSTPQVTNFACALKWLWLFRFRNISRPVRVILYLNYLNAIYPLKQFPLHRSVFFFRELKHDK